MNKLKTKVINTDTDWYVTIITYNDKDKQNRNSNIKNDR